MSRENNGNPKQKLNLTKVLLMVGFIPLVAAGVLICVISGITTAANLTEDVYDKLFVASDGLRKYYQYELEAGNEMPYEHDYVDMLKGDDISTLDAVKKGPKNMLEDLPNPFNEAQLEALRAELGKNKEGTKAQLRQWMHRKFIEYSSQTGLYSKTDEYLKKSDV